MKNFQKNEILVFVVSDLFMHDQHCRETITRAVTLRPRGVVQIIRNLFASEEIKDKLILSMATADHLVYYDENDEDKFSKLLEKLVSTV